MHDLYLEMSLEFKSACGPDVDLFTHLLMFSRMKIGITSQNVEVFCNHF